MLVQFNNTVKSDTNYHEVNLSAPKLNNSNLQVLSKNNNAYLTGWARLVKSPPNTHVILRLKKIPNSWPSSLRMIRVLWMVVSFSFDFYFLPRITSNLKNYTSPSPTTPVDAIPRYTLLYPRKLFSKTHILDHNFWHGRFASPDHVDGYGTRHFTRAVHVHFASRSFSRCWRKMRISFRKRGDRLHDPRGKKLKYFSVVL